MGGNSFSKSYTIRWSDLDPNRHMRNTAYGDYATDLRFSYLEASGISLERFAEFQIGPVAFRESTEYHREVHLGETVTMALELAGMAPDGTRWRLRHTLYKEDGAKAATIEMEGAWLDLRRRKLTVPPGEICDILRALAPTADYEDLRSGKRGR